MSRRRYSDVDLGGVPCVFVRRGGTPIGYVIRVGDRWRPYAHWTGCLTPDWGHRYRTRYQAASALDVAHGLAGGAIEGAYREACAGSLDRAATALAKARGEEVAR